MYDSTKKRIEMIRAIVDEYYEPGRQGRCKSWVWRTVIYPRFGISRRTFFRYLSAGGQCRDSQLTLF